MHDNVCNNITALAKAIDGALLCFVKYSAAEKGVYMYLSSCMSSIILCESLERI